MAKLIFEKGVVEERADLNPVTGRWRVVYEKQGERFKCLLDEDEDFNDGRRGLSALVKHLKAGPDYVVYAVSQDKHLLSVFTERVDHQNQLNHFDLTFTLTYYVSDPKLLIRQLRASQDDPLARLNDKALKEVGGACARLAWETITDEYAFADEAARLTAPGSPPARAVQSIAHALGLAVSDIKLGLRLLEEDMEEARRRREHRFTLAERQRELEVTRATETIEDEKAARVNRREVAGAITDSVKNMVIATDNLGKLQNQVNLLGAILPSVADAGAGTPPPNSNQKLLRDKSSGGDPGASVLAEIVDLISELNVRESERRKLFAAAYHLAAELLAADEARPDALAYYQEKYRTRLEDLETTLRTQQYDTLALLLEIEHL